jgi:hypothetical protein
MLDVQWSILDSPSGTSNEAPPNMSFRPSEQSCLTLSFRPSEQSCLTLSFRPSERSERAEESMERLPEAHRMQAARKVGAGWFSRLGRTFCVRSESEHGRTQRFTGSSRWRVVGVRASLVCPASRFNERDVCCFGGVAFPKPAPQDAVRPQYSRLKYSKSRPHCAQRRAWSRHSRT